MRRTLIVCAAAFLVPLSAHAGYAFEKSWGWGVSTGAAQAEVCQTASTCQAGISGSGNGQLAGPFGIAVDSSNNVYVSEQGNNRVQKFNSSGTFVSTWLAMTNTTAGIAIDSAGNVYVGSTIDERIVKLNSAGTFVAAWGWGVTDGSAAYQICTSSCQGGITGTGNGQFSAPYGIAIDSADNVYVVEAGNNRVQKFNSSGTFISKWGSSGNGNGQFNNPEAIAIDGSDNVYVADSANNRIQKFTSAGVFVLKWGSLGSGSGELDYPEGIGTDSAGNVYVSDDENDRIVKFSPTGTVLQQWGIAGSAGNQFDGAVHLALDADDNLYVNDYNNHRVQKFVFTPRPIVSTAAASGLGSAAATLNGSIDDDGTSSSTVRGFAYGTSQSYGATTTESGTFGVGSFSAAIASLSCNTLYNVAAYATNSSGTSYGSNETFTTSACPDEPAPAPSSSPASVSRSSSGSRISRQALAQLLAPSAATTAYLLSLESSGSVSPGTTVSIFTRSLDIGSTGPDVRALQQYLNGHGYAVASSGPGSHGQETIFFGSKTKAGLIRFQKDHGIPATGYFGPITRAYIRGSF